VPEFARSSGILRRKWQLQRCFILLETSYTLTHHPPRDNTPNGHFLFDREDVGVKGKRFSGLHISCVEFQLVSADLTVQTHALWWNVAQA
jgi:hypothetical protein